MRAPLHSYGPPRSLPSAVGPRHLGADSKPNAALDRKFEGKTSEPSVTPPRGGISQKQESATARETCRFSSDLHSNDARIMDIENIAQAMCLLPVSRQAGESPAPSAAAENREHDRDTSKARSTGLPHARALLLTHSLHKGVGHHADRPGNDATPTSMSAKVIANRQVLRIMRCLPAKTHIRAEFFTDLTSHGIHPRTKLRRNQDASKPVQRMVRATVWQRSFFLPSVSQPRSYYVLGGRWESKITFKSKTRHIGTFDSEIEAALA